MFDFNVYRTALQKKMNQTAELNQTKQKKTEPLLTILKLNWNSSV